MLRRLLLLVTPFLAAAFVNGARADDTVYIDVQISPSNIVLGLDKGAAVTVHTDIAFSTVDRNTVALSGLAPYLTKADITGNLVAKFRQSEVEAILSPGVAALTLTGLTQDGLTFEGADSIRVIADPAPPVPNGLTFSNGQPAAVKTLRVMPAQTLTQVEVDHILFMREEEKLARDVYIAMYDLWGVRVFDNISRFEQNHMDAIKNLIDTYGLNDPVVDDTPGVFTNGVFSDLYAQLTTQGSGSLVDALGVGAYIEDLDIVDLRNALSEVECQCVVQVFENLEAGSCNHLRAFVQLLTAQGETYTPEFLTQDDFDAIIDGAQGGPQGPNGQQFQQQQRQNRLQPMKRQRARDWYGN
ncbi:MAG TPA: DUF2202 domain-containing protein [Phycisphaerae bacterium]|nr:DUF2202 domain-containing protein [Phycisphaerae bacterium]